MSASERPEGAPLVEGALDLSLLAEIPDPLGPSTKRGEALEEVRAKIDAEPRAPTRSEMRTRRLLALVVSALWLAAFVGVLGLRHDLTSEPATIFGHVVVPAVLGAAALYLAVAPGRIGLGTPLGWLRGATIAAPLAFAGLAALGATSFDLREPRFFLHAFVCGAVSLVLGVIPMVAAMVGLRRVCVSAAPWRSALVGVGIGLCAASTLGLHCSEGGGYHVLIGHVTPVLALALLAVVVVRRYARAD